jgi:hypothetical protein
MGLHLVARWCPREARAPADPNRPLAQLLLHRVIVIIVYHIHCLILYLILDCCSSRLTLARSV